jgi:hypothetical protein
MKTLCGSGRLYSPFSFGSNQVGAQRAADCQTSVFVSSLGPLMWTGGSGANYHEESKGAAFVRKMRPTTTPSASTSKSSSWVFCLSDSPTPNPTTVRDTAYTAHPELCNSAGSCSTF